MNQETLRQRFELTITLTIRGPFITGSGTDAARGFDLMFSRNANDTDTFVLRASHVKGKLREAIRDMQSAGLLTDFALNYYFGQPSDTGVLPRRGQCRFHDFSLISPKQPETTPSLTRVRIDTDTGTAKENALITIEQWLRTGEASVWEGRLDVWASDDRDAETVRQSVLLGLKWITHFGAMKGSGYGRVERVKVEMKRIEPDSVFSAALPAPETLTLQLTFDEELLIGSILRGTNFLESRAVIPGGVIKGALARFLNDLCGSQEPTVTGRNASVTKHFPELATHFHRLRVSHAFPACPGTTTRPVTVPFSLVKDDNGVERDLALAFSKGKTPGDILLQGRAPFYQIDWKEGDDAPIKAQFGWADVSFCNTTRTAIERDTRAAEEEQLYTYQYVLPEDAHDNKIPWRASIRLPQPQPGEITEEEVRALAQQLIAALNAGWRDLGKRDSRFTLQVTPGAAAPHCPRHASGYFAPTDDPSVKQAIIVLQTDALLFDPHAVSHGNFDPAERLRALYKEYWHHVTEHTCEMSGYFARQTMAGRYLVTRFRPDIAYYPYILTEAGSVFALRTRDWEKAQQHLERFERQGLPLPQTMQTEPGKQGSALWEACPFTPEDGFGEICINLDWHWQHYCEGDEYATD
ncbi:hypothetical protein U14_02619 [Candidatus Moduliflexus flocculans]|uniref:CRISPR type III-associated protein domain-containing protein n=1 Tax=Candidatus Moduliflexus flocculans TaxID=1499966 RepID=A0A081BLW0_9BACT|nr:hypothetical protein U14_02619 [Candidatus Moduliflexus flocculans]